MAAPPAGSFFSRLNPVPTFPTYTGPHKVGTVDVEFPVSELKSPSPAPEGTSDIPTVQFRIFYPCTSESSGKAIPWLPSPQRLHVAAYAQFLGAGSLLASALSFLPRHLHYSSIPVHKNATVLRPPPESPARWPTIVFSHGLGGNRNAYSHLAGSLASHGVIVVCPEHRDGSAAVSLVRDPKSQHRRNTRQVPYRSLSHVPTRETWGARDKQIRIRLWELGLGFEAVSEIDSGNKRLIQSNMNKSTPEPALSQLAGLLDVKEPGRTIFAGHSFGAASIVQLLKSTYYADRPEITAMTEPFFTPAMDSSIRKQIAERSPTMCLDLWCMPLLSSTADPLFKLPLPVYADTPSAPGGKALLAIESDHFFQWRENLDTKARIFSPRPSDPVVTAATFERPGSRGRFPEPTFFYVKNSAHLNQSDFGILFPWLTKRVFGAEQPERCLRLNTRAQLQFLRNNGYNVAPTSACDLVDGGGADMGAKGGFEDDKAILDPNGVVDSWGWVKVLGLGPKGGPTELERRAGTRKESEERRAEEAEQEMEGEMEPSRGKPGGEEKVVEAAGGAVKKGTEV
ncbi:platelet-activating factor acetylhydrolase, isoform II-domain-containing protein [Cercophora newfieldiana]|uniref:Putative phospholipase n=1 Tax=Cercophora newfieldiana TaxID=92897 RepID=A0AA39YHK1_9PEZI|nr:platelet-activating factor acetylhydrolase, isoform II-domain-containing protein [Cercophora newfieldiana]